MGTRHYDECYFVNYDSYDDLNLYEIGCQKCPSGYSFGPIIRNNYVLHYILEGTGTLYLQDQAFPVSAGQAFVIPPKLVAHYAASNDTPWNYIWIHFNGQKTSELLYKAGITSSHPVFIPACRAGEIRQCMQDLLKYNSLEYTCIGNTYRLFQLLCDTTTNAPSVRETDKALRYIREVIRFISNRYQEPIKIQEIADLCGLDRSYLCKIFKHATNYTPQEYLIFFRIKKAKQLLKDPELPIQHIAYSVGYNDPFAFSKVFKKETGVSPSQYRADYLNSR